jgi:hypothetical protein
MRTLPTPGRRAVWRPATCNVTILAVMGTFVCVRHHDHGDFWTPANELTLLPTTRPS